MTIPEFIEELRATPGPWRLSNTRELRCTNGKCPLARVAGTEDPLDWRQAAEWLGLSFDDAEAIADAADYQQWPANEDLRWQLLDATGIVHERT
jgi:hypothetical protein